MTYVLSLLLATVALGQIGAPCPTPDDDPWQMVRSAKLADHNASVTELAGAGYRPVSISVNGTVQTLQGLPILRQLRYSSVWLKDGAEWHMEIDMDEATLNAELTARWADGYYPISIDSYHAFPVVAAQGVRYAVVWERNRDAVWNVHVARLKEGTGGLDDIMAGLGGTGHRPLWLAGCEDHGDGNGSRFTMITVADGGTGDVSVDYESADFNDEDAAQDLVNARARLLNLSGYETADGTLYCGAWKHADPLCEAPRWEAFRSHENYGFIAKHVSQIPVSATLPVNSSDDPLELTPDIMNVSTFRGKRRFSRVARIRLERPAAGPDLAVRRITMKGGAFQAGDIVVLEAAHGRTIVVEEPANMAMGQHHIRLKPWIGWEPTSFALEAPSLIQGKKLTRKGQPLKLETFQDQIVLWFDPVTQRWIEFERNGISHGRYRPVALDEHGATSSDTTTNENRRFASVWVEVGNDREFRVHDIDPNPPAGPSNLDAFDDVFEEFMRATNASGGALAIAVTDPATSVSAPVGRLVLARGYTYEPGDTPDMTPHQMFRVGSISKSITCQTLLKLHQEGTYATTDLPFVSINGVSSLVQPNNWVASGHMNMVTLEQMMNHTGGFRRGLIGDVFDIANSLHLSSLPVKWPEFIAHHWIQHFDSDGNLESPMPWVPGGHFQYSNLGMQLLGLPIQELSGQTYEDAVISRLFAPHGLANMKVEQSRHIRYPNEVLNYTHAAEMTSSHVGWPSERNHPDRQADRWDHADQALAPYNGSMLDPANPAGLWRASAVDFARHMVSMRNNEVLDEEHKRRMLAWPERRSKKVVYYSNAAGAYTDHSHDARMEPASGLIPTPLPTGDFLYIGKGYIPFGEVDIEFRIPSAQAYTLEFEYFGSNPQGGPPIWKTLPGVDDQTAGFTQNGKLVYDIPEDWAARGLNAGFDDYRYWIRIRATSAPAIAVDIQKVDSGSENTYTHGHVVDTLDESELVITNQAGGWGSGDTILGAASQASANVEGAVLNANNDVVLTLSNLQGGPFQPGEAITSSGGSTATAADRDWPTVVEAWHNGAMAGTFAYFRIRKDDVDFIYMLNWSRESAFYVPSVLSNGSSLESAIDAAIDTVMAGAGFPNHDLF